MAAEIKTKSQGGVKVETVVSLPLKNQFERTCKKQNISMAQATRDFIQGFVKFHKPIRCCKKKTK